MWRTVTIEIQAVSWLTFCDEAALTWIITEQKLYQHTSDAVTRRDPSIQALAARYNSLVEKMELMVRKGKAPAGVLVPRRIDPKKSLFQLDIDDDVWQDIGLDSCYDGNPPLWLSDPKVRSGIRGLLELDRCREEAERLVMERRGLQTWFAEEWNVLHRALAQDSELWDSFLEADSLITW